MVKRVCGTGKDEEEYCIEKHSEGMETSSEDIQGALVGYITNGQLGQLIHSSICFHSCTAYIYSRMEGTH